MEIKQGVVPEHLAKLFNQLEVNRFKVWFGGQRDQWCVPYLPNFSVFLPLGLQICIYRPLKVYSEGFGKIYHMRCNTSDHSVVSILSSIGSEDNRRDRIGPRWTFGKSREVVDVLEKVRNHLKDRTAPVLALMHCLRTLKMCRDLVRYIAQMFLKTMELARH